MPGIPRDIDEDGRLVEPRSFHGFASCFRQYLFQTSLQGINIHLLNA